MSSAVPIAAAQYHVAAGWSHDPAAEKEPSPSHPLPPARLCPHVYPANIRVPRGVISQPVTALPGWLRPLPGSHSNGEE